MDGRGVIVAAEKSWARAESMVKHVNDQSAASCVIVVRADSTKLVREPTGVPGSDCDAAAPDTSAANLSRSDELGACVLNDTESATLVSGALAGLFAHSVLTSPLRNPRIPRRRSVPVEFCTS